MKLILIATDTHRKTLFNKQSSSYITKELYLLDDRTTDYYNIGSAITSLREEAKIAGHKQIEIRIRFE